MDEQTAQSWHLEQQLQTFRHVVSDTSGNSFTRNLSLAKLKFPFPHMVSLVAREQEKGRLQLLTQGTADIVLDVCQDGWTCHARDYHPLLPGTSLKQRFTRSSPTRLVASTTGYSASMLQSGMLSRYSSGCLRA